MNRLTDDQYELAETFLRLCAAGFCLLNAALRPQPHSRSIRSGPLEMAVERGDELLRTVLTTTYEPKSKA